jgi:chromate transporter
MSQTESDKADGQGEAADKQDDETAKQNNGESAPPEQSYWQVFWRFLHFGFLAWGGPVAQIAMVREDLVEREQWISTSRFNRLLAVYQVLPGPEAHELCVYLGMRARGRLGGLLAGLGFMRPGAILMFILSWLYFSFDITQSKFAVLFYGIQPAVIALIVLAVYKIGKDIVIDGWLWGIAIVAGVAAMFGTSFWITLPVAGLAYVLFSPRRYALGGVLSVLFVAVILAFAFNLFGAAGGEETVAVSAASQAKPSLLTLFFSGLRSGMLTFGGAYTVIPFLRGDAVGRGWMTDAQFLDGLALSGILPAPLIIFSTFVGYAGGGVLGALVMTVGIFLPAFVFTLFLHDYLEKLVENKLMRSFFDGVSAGVVGLIAATTIELAQTAIKGVPKFLPALVIFILSLAVLYLWKAKIAVLVVVLSAGLLGFLLFR